jgi:hypothetical protein
MTEKTPDALTYFQIAKRDQALDPATGISTRATIVGASANVGAAYPKAFQPMSADVGAEEPLGDDLHPGPVGTPSEVAASIARQ